MEQFISETLFDNPLEGLLENQYLEEFDFTKNGNLVSDQSICDKHNFDSNCNN